MVVAMTRQQVAIHRQHVTPYTCVTDGLEHLVTDEDWAVGRHHGMVRAVDGHEVLVAPSDVVGAQCATCHAVVHGEPEHRMEVPRLSLWARLFSRRGEHAR